MQDDRTQQKKSRRTPGIEVRHSRSGRSRSGGECNCKPSYRAEIFDKNAKPKDQAKPKGAKIRKTGWSRGRSSTSRT